MNGMANRRQFLGTAALGGAFWAGLDAQHWPGLPSVKAEDAKLPASVVQLRPEVEPLVRLLEETPRDKVLSVFADKIRSGTSYQEVLATLLLAGVRNVQPRPSVGFKFHAVLVINSAHLASQAGPDADRWLPIFWALDYFKSAQADDAREGNWTMAPVEESKVPPAGKARDLFIEAMDQWDVAKADVAVAALARSASVNEVFELFYRYGARDYRSIGHKAIFVSNSRRALEAIGWQHAEPVLRSLAYALLMHEGTNPAQREDVVDIPGRQNADLARRFRPDWIQGKFDDQAAGDLLAALRKASAAEASGQVVEMVNGGVSPSSVWDALFNAAGELLMRQPGIVGLHTLTTLNALHNSYQQTSDDLTRRWLMLQAAAFLPLFHASMQGRGKVGEQKIDELEPLPPDATGADAVREIFSTISTDRPLAARKLLSLLTTTPELAPSVLSAARALIFAKGRDSHDYKFSSAILEDYHSLRSPWRDRLLAASVFQLRGSGDTDNALVARTRVALNS